MSNDQMEQEKGFLVASTKKGSITYNRCGHIFVRLFLKD